MKKLAIVMLMGGMAIGAVPASAVTCSGGQTISNRTVQKLEVTSGNCFVDHVTVNAGITVDGGAQLQLSNATVNGGVNVAPNGELDIQNTIGTNGIHQPILGSSTINGGIVLKSVLTSRLATPVSMAGSV